MPRIDDDDLKSVGSESAVKNSEPLSQLYLVSITLPVVEASMMASSAAGPCPCPKERTLIFLGLSSAQWKRKDK